MLRRLFFSTLLLFSGWYFNLGIAQNAQADSKHVAEWINSKTFVFQPQTAEPLVGSARQMTSDYELSVSPDTIKSYLPYFGRAYSATIGETESALTFVSTQFSFKATAGKKGSWRVTITPKDAKDVRQLFFDIYSNGYGSLQVMSNNRQDIRFSGLFTTKK